MLDAMAPRRIDLGLGQAPGTDVVTASALRRHQAANNEFPQQVAELLGFLEASQKTIFIMRFMRCQAHGKPSTPIEDRC